MAEEARGTEYTAIDLASAWKKVNMRKFNAGIVWSLNSPDCLCQSCYDSWLNSGKEIYVEKDSGYLNRIAQEEFHRKQVISGRCA